MNILITGSSGFLGKEVVNLLKNNKYYLTFLTRKKKNKKNYVFCNLNNKIRLRLILKKLNPKAIINLAAEVDFNKNTNDMYKVNSQCPNEIAKYCKKKKIHFIHASSISVHGIKKTYSKKTKFNPINHYGKSKLKGDNLIIKSNCKYSILRFGGIYGKNGPNHLEINRYIKLAQKEKKIEFDGNKKNLRNYIFVKDAAQTILHCLQHKKYGIFYVGGEILSFESMLKKISKILSKNNNVLFLNKSNKIDNQIVKTDKLIKLATFAKSLELIK